MVKKLVFMIAFVAVCSTVSSTAQAAKGKRAREDENTPEREGRVHTPKAPRVLKVDRQIMMNLEDVLAAGLDMDNIEPVRIAPRNLISVFDNLGE